MSSLLVLYAIFAINVIPLIASFVGPIPIAYAYFGLALIASVGALWLVKGRLPKGELKVNKLDEWVGVGTLTALLFVIGQTLLALSAFPSATHSVCFDPANATVTSPLCKTIQTKEILQNSFLGNLGALVLQVAVIWTVVLVGLIGLFYVLYVLPTTLGKTSWYVPE